ncbi:MAG TPA: hypothetical protein VHX49_04075 [Candidatus Acidoferrales bacterium]|nr:hypothetical protein [Candidatus Acidoferrales bacterium]
MQKLFGIIQEFVGLLGVHSESSGGKLGRDRRLCYGGIGRHEADFIYVNVRVALKGGLQLLSQLHRLGVGTGRKPSDEACKARLGDLWREVDAGDAGTREHASEALLRSSRIKRGTIEQESVARSR